MSLEVEATFENGVLKPSQQLPLREGEKVKLTIEPAGSAVDRLYGMLKWTGSREDLDYLLGPDNQCWGGGE